MSRRFKAANYEETLNQSIRLGEALPAQHLARFVVDIIAELDLSRIYRQYAPVGGEAIAPEILLGLVFYGYATGLFSSRKIEKATYESIPFRYIAGGLHPDHDTIANFRKTILGEIQELFVQSLLLAQAAGVLQLGNISLDGSKVYADASKSHALSYKRLLELETGKIVSYEQFADDLIVRTGLTWPSANQTFAQNTLRFVIKRLVIHPLEGLGCVECKYRMKSSDGFKPKELVEISLTPFGRGLLETL